MRHETRAFTQNYFNGLQNKRDIESNWKLIKSFLDSTVKRNIPSKMSSGRKSLPWVSIHIQRLIRRRDRLHSLYKRTRKTNIYDKWVEMRSRIKKEIRASHTNFVNGILWDVKTDCKPFWKYINGKRKDKHCIPPLQTKDKIVFSDIDKAEAFNEQFSSVFTRNTSDEIPLQCPVCVRMDDIHVSTFGVEKLLRGLKTSTAVVPDNTHPWVLKELATDIAPTISHLFQQSITDGSLPRDWRTANICPIYKKNDVSSPSNYRPVSLTSICCKLLEHIISSNIMEHFQNNNILTAKQHAFRKYHSCETQLVSVINEWASSLDQRKQVDVFILDFEKAFDTVPHELLKSKLYTMGVTHQVLCWVDAFLSDREQSVVVNGSRSNPSKVTSGVPKGQFWDPFSSWPI
ncbi:hypothetical protein BSL78_25949 [Apostichopus japonicus]|uniref:Reverse transcriptase domain-containing protein n=1 Tax=Stichopus japonicus TaxID=307972 RepID=A0A2G8JNB2_STIJA|nr:hypothetical protein BSL78_25949 [Apostichopus japonicus]